MKIRSATLLVLLAPFLFAGCSGCELIGCGEDRPEYETDYGGGEGVDVGSVTYSIFQIFQSTGVSSEMGPEVETGIFDRPAREITVVGSPVFFVEFGETDEADRVAASIAADGRAVGEKPVPSTAATSGRPHWFRSGKVIAFYFGERARTIDALREVFGEPIVVGS